MVDVKQSTGSSLLLVGDSADEIHRVRNLLAADGFSVRLCHQADDLAGALGTDRFTAVVIEAGWWRSLDAAGRDRMAQLIQGQAVCLWGEAVQAGNPPSVVDGVIARSDVELLAQMHRFEAERLGEAFRENETRFRLMLEQVPAMLWTTDLELRFTSSMGAGLAALGLKPGEVVGMSLDTYFRQGDDEPIQLKYHLRAMSGESVRYEDHWVGRHYDVYIEPLCDGAGRIVGCLGVAMDITRRKQAEEAMLVAHRETEARVVQRTAELRDANERLRREIADRRGAEAKLRERDAQIAHVSRLSTLGEIATGMAHELNQPLAAIANYTHGTLNRLGQWPSVPDGVIGALEQIARQTERAAQIIHRLRSMVKRRQAEPAIQNLATLARESVEMVELNARRHGVLIQFQVEDLVPCVHADPTELVQVIVNLLCNAIDAMADVDPSNRLLTVRTVSEPAGMVTLKVTDRGPGLTEESKVRAFDTFYTGKPDGLGLGLPISRTIIESAGGRLWGRNNTDGPGATFAFCLPAAGRPEVPE